MTLLWAKLEATSKAARPGIFKCGQFLVHQCGKTYVPTALYVYERKRINVSKVFASTRTTSPINTAERTQYIYRMLAILLLCAMTIVGQYQCQYPKSFFFNTNTNSNT